jgi:PAS domain S-box-containing protein
MSPANISDRGPEIPRSPADDTSAYRRLLSKIDEGFCLLEKVSAPAGSPSDYRYVEVNPAFEVQSGIRGVVGKTIRAVVPGEPEEWFTSFDEVLRTGVSQRFERGLATQGRVLEVHIYRVETDEGHCLAVLFTDITKHKRIEEDLRASEYRLRKLNADLQREVLKRAREREQTWQTSPDLLGALNSKGYFETSNPAWMSMLGWTEGEVASMSIFELLHPDDVERTRAGFELTQLGEPAIRFPNRYRGKDGTYRWISWVGVPVDGMVYCSGRDITEEKANAVALETAQQALRQSQKMEAVGQLTGGIAHDFNNLLAGIGINIEMARTKGSVGELDEGDRNLAAAQAAVKRAAALTHRLLAFSRQQDLAPISVDANRLISDLEELIRRTVGPSIDVEVVGTASLWPALVDPNQLENAVLNLAINARDAMPQGGRLTIETANKWLDHQAAAAFELVPGQYMSIAISDSGAGMAPEVLARAFDPFFTTKPLGQGTGLGLSMVHGFVRQSGGQVRLYSEVGHGTTIELYFPKHSGLETQVDSDPGAPTQIPRAHGETVLVVDDETSIRSVVVEVLKDAGYNVVEAVDGPTAVQALQLLSRLDLLITDVGLPGGMNGRQVADAGRQRFAAAKVLFITGYAENAAVRATHLDVGMRVMTKPFTIVALMNKVREMISG